MSENLQNIHLDLKLIEIDAFIKVDFSNFIFTDYCRANSDGPDSWCRGWKEHGKSIPMRIKRQPGYVFARHCRHPVNSLFEVDDGVKIISENYISFL